MIDMAKIKDTLIGSVIDLLYHSVRIRMEVKEIAGVANTSMFEKSDFFAPHRGNILGIMRYPKGNKLLVIDNRKNKGTSPQGEVAVRATLVSHDRLRIEAVLVYEYEYFNK